MWDQSQRHTLALPRSLSRQTNVCLNSAFNFTNQSPKSMAMQDQRKSCLTFHNLCPRLFPGKGIQIKCVCGFFLSLLMTPGCCFVRVFDAGAAVRVPSVPLGQCGHQTNGSRSQEVHFCSNQFSHLLLLSPSPSLSLIWGIWFFWAGDKRDVSACGTEQTHLLFLSFSPLSSFDSSRSFRGAKGEETDLPLEKPLLPLWWGTSEACSPCFNKGKVPPNPQTLLPFISDCLIPVPGRTLARSHSHLCGTCRSVHTLYAGWLCCDSCWPLVSAVARSGSGSNCVPSEACVPVSAFPVCGRVMIDSQSVVRKVSFRELFLALPSA